MPSADDTDGDGIANALDNCPMQINPDQGDVDLDAIGDSCDLDDDNDGVADLDDCGPGDQNIFPGAPDDPTDGIDSDCDGQLEVVDVVVIDSDGDGLSDDDEIQLGLNPFNADTDSDGSPDGVDSFPDNPNASLDTDNDGVSDNDDQFPNDATETADLNGDGLGDNANPFEGTIITGTVVNAATQAAVEGAQISLELTNSLTDTTPVVVTITDTLGAYTLVAPNDLIPESFILVITADGFQPVPKPLNNGGDDIIDAFATELVMITEDFVTVEALPRVHHLGDDSFSGAANSQFQRPSEGVLLTRSFNVSQGQASSNEIAFQWVAKGIQNENLIIVNGTTVATTSDTATDGSFTVQTILLPVTGLLSPGANTISVQSVATEFQSDVDDFEFVFVGLFGSN